MRWMLEYIKKEVSYTSNSGTIYLDLPDGGQIGLIMLECDATVSSTADSDNSILDLVEKIRVNLDGSKIAYSMQPEVGSFAWIMQSGKQPPHELSSRATAEDIMRLPICFGRFPFDEEFGLDMGNYKSGSIEIDYTVDTTDYDTTTFDLTAWYLTPIEPLAFRGLIRSRIIEDKASPTASADHEVDFPVTYPYLVAFGRIDDVDEYPTTNVTDLEFRADNGRYEIFDGRIEDLMQLNDLILDPFFEGPIVRHNLVDNEYGYTFMGYQRMIDVQPFCASDGEMHPTSWKGSRVKVSSTWAAVQKAMFVQAIGRMPYDCLIVGDWRDRFFDAPAHDDIMLTYTVGSTAPDKLQTVVMEVVEGVL